MITKTRIYTSDSTNPYYNLAVEEYLFNQVGEDECILYLWQNKRTVVIGRNQNPLKECKTEELAADGGFLARRLSGGGSVYHDLGNLNFTFLVKEPDYDVDRQLSVIIKAMESLGLPAEKTGRNDICIDGRKFSGNAFYKHKGRCYHHGTILVSVDLQEMTKYLHVSPKKLQANGVASVKSRVVNLKDLNPEIDIPKAGMALKAAFAEVYMAPGLITLGDLEGDGKEELEKLEEKYAGEDWRFGRHMKADFLAEEKFSWGEIGVHLQIEGKTITDVQVFSDAMDTAVSQVVCRCLKGVPFQQDTIQKALSQGEGELDPAVQKDIMGLLNITENTYGS